MMFLSTPDNTQRWSKLLPDSDESFRSLCIFWFKMCCRIYFAALLSGWTVSRPSLIGSIKFFMTNEIDNAQ